MPVYWNFRAVLDIDKKNRSCVGTKKGKNVGRCSNIVHHRDLKAAGHLLDQMDQSKSFKGSIDRLETLAGLLLCKGVHNNHKTKARLSQVDEVTEKWTIIVEEKYRIIERQREKELLLRMSESARQIKAELEEERADKVYNCLQAFITVLILQRYYTSPRKMINPRAKIPTEPLGSKILLDQLLLQ